MRIKKYSLLVLVVFAIALVANGCNSSSKTAAWKMIEKHKSVRIGTDPANIPFEYGSGTEVQGLEVEIGNEIVKDINQLDMAKEIGPLETMWVKYSGYNKVFDVLAAGEVEFIISTIAVDPNRTDKFAFSKPFYDSGDAIAYRMLDKPIENLESLSGKKVGVATGRPSDMFMAAQKGVSLVKFENIDLALAALNRIELDAVVGDRPIMTYSTFESFQNVTIAPASFNNYKYAAVVRKDETELLDSINKTIDRMISSGQIEQLKQTWYQKKADEFEKNRGEWIKKEAQKKAPKPVSVYIKKSQSNFKMDRLDGFQLVLQGPAGRFTSSHIETNGNSGSCSFGPIPPGVYTLDMSKILQTVARVEIQEKAVKSLTMSIDIGRQLSITVH